MTTPAETLRAINRLVAYLLETSLADDQSFAFQLTGSNGTVEVTFSESGYVSIALKNLAYREIYYQLVHLEEFQNNSDTYIEDETTLTTQKCLTGR